MIRTIRLFMLVEAASFVVASLVHSGVLLTGYEHPQARIAEGVIAAVLLAGLTASAIRRSWTRRVGLAGQGFALLGTLIGLFTIAIGVGPRTAPDLVYHAGILAVLVWGLIVATRPAHMAETDFGQPPLAAGHEGASLRSARPSRTLQLPSESERCPCHVLAPMI